PLPVVSLVGVHLLFVQRQGMAPPLGAKVAPRGMRFFPSFALRDLLLWMACFMVLLILAVFVPYGPGIPGMDWELGEKADPLAPAFPGIKPEWYFLWEYQLLNCGPSIPNRCGGNSLSNWYFLWEYQLLKEFPPHLLGMEGPQLCLLVVSLLLGIWAVIPWLDRRAQREQ